MQPRILVVDSDQAHAASCLMMLEREGFAVECAFRFDEAVAAFRRARPDALIVETIVDGGDSSALMRDAARRGIATFSMSDLAVGAVNTAIAMRRDGAAAHWEKPLHRADVLAALRRALGDEYPSPAPPTPPRTGDVHTTPTVERAVTALDEDAPDPEGIGPSGDEPTDITRRPAPPTDVTPRPEPVSTPAPSAAPSAPAEPAPVWRTAPCFERERVGTIGRGTGVCPLTVLDVFTRSGDEGVLEWDAAHGTLSLRIADGHVRGVRASGSVDLAVDMLRADGAVRADQWDALARNHAPAERTLDLLVSAGLLEAEALPTVRSAAARRTLAPWWGVEDLGWAWRAGASDVVDAGLAMSPEQLAWEACTHVLPTSSMRTALRPLDRMALDWPGDRLRRDAMPLTRAQRAAVGSIDGVAAVGALCEDGDATVGVLYALAALGYLQAPA